MKSRPMKKRNQLSSASRILPISLKKFREETGTGQTTLWDFRRRGWLNCVKISNRLFVMPDELDRFKQRAAAGEFASETAGCAAS